MGLTAMVHQVSISFILSVGLDTYGFDFAPFCRLILIFWVAGRDRRKLWMACNNEGMWQLLGLLRFVLLASSLSGL